MIKLTIFTPTYNRKNLLAIAYKNLCLQTVKNFIWLIVDDGSTDGTQELVNTWINEHNITIEYYYQQNSGKMRCHNRAVRLCKSELFVCVDSDDYLIPQSVELIINTWDKIIIEKSCSNLAGIVAYRGCDAFHTMNKEKFPPIQYSTLGELYRNGFYGETTLIYRTEILKHFLFPEIPGEKFIPEDVIYDKIDQFYKLYVLPKVLTICEYQNEGLTRSILQLKRSNPKGFLLYYQSKIQISPPSLLRYKYIAHAILFIWILHGNLLKQIPASKFEIIIAIPGAVFLKLIRKL